MKKLEIQARELIVGKIARNETVNQEWATTELLKAQGEMLADNMEFWTVAGREKARRVIREQIALYDQHSMEAETDRQMVLEGYEHLRTAYSIRDELVPIEQISDDDLLERAKQFDKQAASIKDHAKEIRKFVERRQQKSRAA